MLAALLLFAAAGIARAITTPPVACSFASVFVGDSVVLQSGGSGARVWGSASAGARVSVTLDGAPADASTADSSGRWEALLAPHATSWGAALVASDASSSATARVKFRTEQYVSEGGGELELQQLTNGTAEAAAAGAFTGKISVMSLETPYPMPQRWNGSNCGGWPPRPVPGCVPQPQWNAVTPGPSGTVQHFSGLCFLAGKAIYEGLRGSSPVGLIAGSVGGSPIEVWLPRGVLGGECPADSPPCDSQSNLTDSQFYEALILPFAPYSLGGILWDQGERDVHCFAPATNKTGTYACMERALVATWRAAFKSPDAAFVAVQLPSFIGDCDSVSKLQPDSTFYNCVPGVFNMRLAQDAGVAGVAGAAAVPTYDLSCPFGVVTPLCPFGSVHNVDKTRVAARAAQSLLAIMFPAAFPPRAVSAAEGPTGRGFFQVTVTFAGGGEPIALRPTQHCATCCGSGVGDFDASSDGAVWVNGSLPEISGTNCVTYVVKSDVAPTRARYTANAPFAQCAVYGANGMPAMPFDIAIGW